MWIICIIFDWNVLEGYKVLKLKRADLNLRYFEKLNKIKKNHFRLNCVVKSCPDMYFEVFLQCKWCGSLFELHQHHEVSYNRTKHLLSNDNRRIRFSIDLALIKLRTEANKSNETVKNLAPEIVIAFWHCWQTIWTNVFASSEPSYQWQQ